MAQKRVPAVFMRGGTSNAVVFHERDLPPGRQARDALFLAALGSPDPFGRQLDGMGGGISSLSKACVVGPPTRDDADIDFSFAQVAVREAAVDRASNCGNMSSAMGPFAVDEGLLSPPDGEARVRIHNTNTGKLVHATFQVAGGEALVEGPLRIPGVSGTGAPVRLEFRDPGGAATGRLLPTGRARDRLEVPGLGAVEATLVDAANPCVFVAAQALGLDGAEMPADLDADAERMRALEAIRCAAGAAMGIGPDPETVGRDTPSAPKVGFVAGPRAARDLTGAAVAAGDGDLCARVISMGNTHRALPLTAALCLAVAARIEGSVPHAAARPAADPIRIVSPSGVIEVDAAVERGGAGWDARHAAVYRTQRRLFEGSVLVP